MLLHVFDRIHWTAMSISLIRGRRVLANAGTRCVLFFCLLATGCAVAPTGPARAPQAVLGVSCSGDSELGGRFSVRYMQDDKEESLHGGFSWRQVGERTNITLLSPLGQTMAAIDVTPEGAVMVESGRQPRYAPDADALAAAELGWALPVSGLGEWLRGCALDSSSRRFVASPRNDSVTTKDGWRIRYVSWQEGTAVLMPRRIDLERGAVSLRLVIDRPTN